jgi:hypothetical protein
MNTRAIWERTKGIAGQTLSVAKAELETLVDTETPNYHTTLVATSGFAFITIASKFVDPYWLALAMTVGGGTLTTVQYSPKALEAAKTVTNTAVKFFSDRCMGKADAREAGELNEEATAEEEAGVKPHMQ